MIHKAFMKEDTLNTDKQEEKKDLIDSAVTFTKLPDAEFEIMNVIWDNIPPVTTAMLMNQLGREKGWKLQTLITLLNRLTERGFLYSEKSGKERTYFPRIDKKDYIQYETTLFLKRYHNNSLTHLVNAFSGNNKLSKEELDELGTWLKSQEDSLS